MSIAGLGSRVNGYIAGIRSSSNIRPNAAVKRVRRWEGVLVRVQHLHTGDLLPFLRLHARLWQVRWIAEGTVSSQPSRWRISEDATTPLGGSC